MKNKEAFCKFFFDPDLGQIVMMKKQIDGSAVTIKWAGGTAPTPTANKLDIFNFSLLRVGNAWQVLGSANVNF